jgi:insecticidal toxin complex protein TccC
LLGVKTARPAGHAAGAKVLQDHRYTYDPVGNVVNLQNHAEETRFWRNQKVVPENTYRYDSLYQLVHATGRELANIGREGLAQPTPQIPLPQNAGAYTCYTRDYTYDRGDNLIRMQHSVPATGNSYTQVMTVSPTSNRAVLSTWTEDPLQVASWFDAAGHQRTLQPGRTLTWTARGQLRVVRLIDRIPDSTSSVTSADPVSGMLTTGHISAGALVLGVLAIASSVAGLMSYSDGETYRYDAENQRILKRRWWQTGTMTGCQRVVY